MPSFGVNFGRLVREKRAIEGLSQDDLASRSNLTKARISEIETGKIANPQAKTVDALCVALNISREERASCHPVGQTRLPALALESLARRFGHDNPDALETELEVFLKEKAKEFHDMHQRLALLAKDEEKIADLIISANAALDAGDFKRADDFLEEAERVQLHSTTIGAIEKQAKLAMERGNAALINGDVAVATGHFERSARYFTGIDIFIVADHRHEYAQLLRSYAYRYMNSESLHAAKTALYKNLLIWQNNTHAEKWCQTKNALGGVSWRLSQFDNPLKALQNLSDAKKHYEDVLDVCSAGFLPILFATANLDLSNVYASRLLAKDDNDYVTNLETSLQLQKTALSFFSIHEDKRAYGVAQHNIGCTCITLSKLRKSEKDSANDTENAISHLELSFQVRDPVNSLQYWVASCRSIGEALLNMASYSVVKNADDYRLRALEILNSASAKISDAEHPNQWAEIQQQLTRCADKS